MDSRSDSNMNMQKYCLFGQNSAINTLVVKFVYIQMFVHSSSVGFQN